MVSSCLGTVIQSVPVSGDHELTSLFQQQTTDLAELGHVFWATGIGRRRHVRRDERGPHGFDHATESWPLRSTLWSSTFATIAPCCSELRGTTSTPSCEHFTDLRDGDAASRKFELNRLEKKKEESRKKEERREGGKEGEVKGGREGRGGKKGEE